VLKFLQEFLEAVSLGVTIKSLKVSCRAKKPIRPEYRLKWSITPDPIVGSSSIFSRSFQRLFSWASP
jgi:hypothetical protein